MDIISPVIESPHNLELLCDHRFNHPLFRAQDKYSHTYRLTLNALYTQKIAALNECKVLLDEICIIFEVDGAPLCSRSLTSPLIHQDFLVQSIWVAQHTAPLDTQTLVVA